MAAVALCGTVAATSQGASGLVAVYPNAGTPAASAKTQISFRGAPPEELGAVDVTGSRTGRHTGRLQPHSDGNGASFLPDKPFSPAETVTVRTARPLVGAHGGAVTFKVGRFDLGNGTTHVAALSGGTGAGDGSGGGGSSFHTVDGFHPPSIEVLTRKKGRARGTIFLAPKSGQRAAMMIDDAGKLVWYHPAPHGFRIYDFRRQKYHGGNALTWIEWHDCRSPDCAVGRIYDSAYRQIDSVRAGNGYAADFHEFTISAQNTAYLIINQPMQTDLRSVGGSSNGWMYDSIVQEIDIPTGAVRFEWHALGHVSLKTSGVGPRHGTYDPYHLNSIAQESNGNLLISLRNTNTVYEVDRSSGRILWRLGGKRSNYKMGHGASFIAQHDARRLRNGEITIFDNGSGAGLGNRPSRGIVLELKSGKAYLRRSLKRPHDVFAASQGNVEGLPTGGYFVGWGGQTPYFSEFDHDGHLVYDAQFANTVGNTYRAYRYSWHAHPTDPPAVVATASSSRTKVWVSWNGATEVAKWEVLAGPTPFLLKSSKTVARRGFETSISLNGAHQYVQVIALDSHGSQLGTSNVTRAGSG